MKMVMKLLRMITRTRTLSAGENRPSLRTKMRKIARKPAKPIPSSAINESWSDASTRLLAAQRTCGSAAPNSAAELR